METIVLKATTILCIFIFQKPHRSSKSQDHVACLVRRPSTRKTGDIESLLQEGRTIQSRLPKHGIYSKDEESTARALSRLTLEKSKAALQLISEQSKGTVLCLDNTIPSCNPDVEPQTVREVLTSTISTRSADLS